MVGYPRIFNGTDCNLLTWFSGSEMTRLNQTADQLDSTIGAAAASAGFGFVNPVPAFVGHAVCDRSGVDQRALVADHRVVPPEPERAARATPRW